MDSLSMLVRANDGHLDPTQEQKDAIRRWLTGKSESMVKFSRPNRSLKANAYMWSCVYSLIAEHAGTDTETIHEACRRKFLPRRFVRVGDDEIEVRKSTASLNSKEFTTYLDQVMAWGSSFGIVFPPPEHES